MREFIIWYNKNGKKFLKIAGIFIIVIIIIQLFKLITIKNQEEKQNNFVTTGNENKQDFNTIVSDENKSTVTGEELSKTQTELLKSIDKFAEYCNNNNTDDAYNLLSEECKKEMYPTVEDFIELYYKKIFDGKLKNISVENWVDNIYKVKFSDDALSTGIYNSDNNIQDYISVVKDEDDNYKLNINGYVGQEELNKETEAFDLKIKVVEKNQYMDFTTYTYEVKNGSKNVIRLNDIESEAEMYLEDKNSIKYYAYMNELAESDLRVMPGETKKVVIKYYCRFSSTREITSIVFPEIQLGGNEIARLKIEL